MIRKVEDKYILLSKKGKKLGEFSTRSDAEEREKEIIRVKRARALDKLKSDRSKSTLG